MYDFAKEIYFAVNTTGNKSNQNRTLIRLLKSLSLMIFVCGISNTKFLPSDSDELMQPVKIVGTRKTSWKQL